MFHVQITAIHALGKFKGCLMLLESKYKENAEDVIDEMTANLNGIEKLVLVADDGSFIGLNKQILGQSVLVFEVREFE